MPILNEDIKILKSAVMLDTPDGGGAMTGIEVVGGESNNIFQDTSQINHAIGNVSLMKVFGVAQSPDAATLLGAHVMIAQAPQDPLVHCLLMQASTWAEQRAAARNAIERYVVKSTRFGARVMETHYAGSLVLRMLSTTGLDFPPPGEVLVIADNTHEQYVQIKKIAVATQAFNVTEGGLVVTFTGWVATCDLGAPLAYDFTGPPIARVNTVGNYAISYSTSVAAGARFYGIKPLTIAGDVGDLGVKVGGIFSPVVPASDVETPLIDQRPFTDRGATIPSTVKTLSYARQFGPGYIYPKDSFLCAVKPGSLNIAYAGVGTFTDDGAGQVKYNNGVVFADLDYATGELTWRPNVLGQINQGLSTVNYTPVTLDSAAQKSAYDTVTVVNQGLSYTKSLKPAPVPGGLNVSYMAQGRWYTMTDDGAGKISGGDSSIGVGNVSYATGSVAITLGALPDVGSAILYQWGDTASAVDGTLAADLPAVFEARIDLGPLVDPVSVVVTWSVGVTNYSATVNAAGVVSGNATGYLLDGVLHLKPATVPTSGSVNVAYDNAPAQATFTESGNNLTLTNAPVVPGTVRFNIGITAQTHYLLPTSVVLTDDGAGNIVFNGNIIGGVNYTNGAITLASSVTLPSATYYGPWDTAPGVGVAGLMLWTKIRVYSVSVNFNGVHSGVSYGAGTTASASLVATLNWVAQIPLPIGLSLGLQNLAFTMGGEVYTSVNGQLRKGTVPIALVAAGSVAADGLINVTSLPANLARIPTWINLPINQAAPAVSEGVFRTATAPLRQGQFQMLAGALSASADDAGVLTGGGFTGSVDFERGWVEWARVDPNVSIDADTLTYNTVFLQSVPLDSALLGIDPVRLPSDGRVPIFRQGMICVVHNTQVATLTNPITKGVAYAVGRVRISAVEIRDNLGALVAGSLYDVNYDDGEVTVKTGSDIAAFTQPFKVAHRIEDIVVCADADISGNIKFTRTLTHAFPADTSFVSGALVFGDVFARAFNYFEQTTWTAVWSDTLIGSAPLANFNETLNPIVVTNDGAITERWIILFTSTTAFRVVGQQTGEIATGNISTTLAPVNPATGHPYFSIPSAGWGAGWAPGNVLRFNTNACGAPFWVLRTVLQGAASLASDAFTLAFRGDVDTPAP